MVALCGLCLAAPVLAEHPSLETAKVISQSIGVAGAGYAVVPVGNGWVGGQLGRRQSVVIVETADRRLTWVELTKAPNIHHFLVMTVNGPVSYYRDSDKFVVLDSKGKEHKFGVVHAEAIGSN